MALVATQEVPEAWKPLLKKILRVVDARRRGAVAKKGHLLSREAARNVSQRSLLPECSALWAGLSEPEKEAWSIAGAESGYSGWNLFVQDTSYRLKFGIPGLATPSTLHQYKVGRLEINAPADAAVLAQYHPVKYWKEQKVTGSKGLYEQVPVIEQLVLPLMVGTSYRTNLIATSPEYIARFYAIITSNYQGRDIETEVGFDLDLQSGWKRDTATATEVLGTARDYNLWLEFRDVRGWIEWDNVAAIHTGTNWARDFRCNDVNNELTRVNWQIESSWEETFLPAGAAFDSVYPDD